MNLDQVRARNAFERVQGYCGDRPKLLGLARSLPVMLQTNGLLATWAHLLAKGEAEHRAATAALLAHFRHDALRLAPAGRTEQQVFFELWTAPGPSSTGERLRRLTSEAIAYSVWLKRAAEALLDTGDAGGSAPSSAPGGSASGGAGNVPAAAAGGEHAT